MVAEAHLILSAIISACDTLPLPYHSLPIPCDRRGINWSGVDPPLSSNRACRHGLHRSLSSAISASDLSPVHEAHFSLSLLPGWG